MNTKELAILSNVSSRTLQYYDKIGLLSPKRNAKNDYREYDNDDINKLQQILFFRACGFKLAKIKEILENPSFDKIKTFQMQKNILLAKRNKIDKILETLEKSMKEVKGEVKMNNEDKFKGFDFSSNTYEEEARKLYGDKAVDDSKNHLNSLSKSENKSLEDSMNQVFFELAKVKNEDPKSEIAQNEIDKMFKFFNSNFGHKYSLEAFAALGQMYIDDERFNKNIDKFAEGLSMFIAEATKIYANKKSED